MTEAALWLRIDLADGRVGPGKIALLEAIAEAGSISAAARSLGMSYRRAWELVAELNQTFSSPVVERITGGAGGAATSFLRAKRVCFLLLGTLVLRTHTRSPAVAQVCHTPACGPRAPPW